MWLKLLIFLLVAVLIYRFIVSKLKGPASTPKEESQTMLPCAKCGTYAQESQMILSEGKHYCSSECAA